MSNPEQNGANPQTVRPVESVTAADDDKKLFVGGLSWDTTTEHLVEYFRQWGEVQGAAVKTDRVTGQSRGFGFVVYVDEASITKALEVKEHRLNNKKIDPKPASSNVQTQKKVFVGGIDPVVTEEQIRDYFGKFGAIESLDLPFDTVRGQRKSYLFITFSTEEGAKAATKAEKQDLFGRKCDVRIAVPPDQASKHKVSATPNFYQQGYTPGYPQYQYGQMNYSQGYGYPQSYPYPGYYADPSAAAAATTPAAAATAAPAATPTTAGYTPTAYPGYSGYYNNYYYPQSTTGYQYPTTTDQAATGGKMRGGAIPVPTYHPYRT
jgi:RNA recognition motif-containing protein